jgi:uncharacterized ion transporter superfamily protein YfcC
MNPGGSAMVEKKKEPKSRLRRITVNVMKAIIKSVIFYVVYYFLWTLFAPASQFIPGLQTMFETFFIIYIILMIVGELTNGTIYHYFFSGAKTLFVISYMIMSLGGGIIGLSYENISLLVDLRLFVVIAMLLGTLGLAKSVLQAINFMNEKAEPHLI